MNTKHCAYCHQEFFRQSRDPQWDKRKFCSSDCQVKNNQQRLAEKRGRQNQVKRPSRNMNAKSLLEVTHPIWLRFLMGSAG